MKISRFLKIMGAVFMALLIGITASLFLLNNAFKESRESTQREIKAKELGSELKFSSSYLTEQVQNYVQFGEKKYYDTYWKEVNETKRRDKILENLREINIPNELVDMVTKAKTNSDALVKLEEEAMIIAEEGDFDKARGIIFSSNYESEVAKINDPINEFLDKMNTFVAEETEKSTKRLNNIIIIITILVVIICVFIIYIFATLIKKINKLVEVSKRLKELSNNEGDLTARLSVDSNDEIGEISLSFNNMLESLQQLIKDVNYTSNEVNIKSEEFRNMTGIASEGNEQIAATMEELAAGSEEQANLSSHVSHSTSELNRFIELLKLDGNNLRDSSEDIQSITEDGSLQMKKTIEQVIIVNDLIKNATDNIISLETKSKEISKLIQVINDIAEQTNLLSLNAAIEAARAGESGKGFAVVAEEIRNLSDQVGESVDDITRIVDNIQIETRNMTEVLGKGYHEVEEGTNQIKITGQTFENINEKISDMANKIQEIYDGLETMSSNSSEINSSIENVAAIIQESTAATEEVSATVQEQSNSMENISQGAYMLFELSSKLSNIVAKFKIE
ncbi:methyl-accepting chemotaxis protein Mcp [Gottschalkia acidurici 9a]|uniref:Methyl-accepting chemotaxis protein Mcp n=1 Tax=Gottschalkia acidurici (strain ATCC 7906 / DSM 604 / BCRC 14475 / CIP 104303 / KCTC 5404 / NCIMB 10678 / 9a) TaxID=1128398 RepID=K0B324_GOTA9|nr:methyl-accepting chemotaxis protein Mcp [Gottschalkia acidurici 9a]